MASDKVVERTSDEFVEKIASAVADAAVKVQERTNPTEKRTPSLVSVYNPEGLAKRPKLRARYIFCNAEQKEDTMTNAEILLMNQITEPQELKNGWKVRVRTDGGGKDTVFIDLPVADIDQRMIIPPSLTLILQEILKTQPTSTRKS